MIDDIQKNIVELNKSLAIKKEIKYNLKECLSDLTKNNLNELAAIYQVVGRHKMKKDDLVSTLFDSMQNEDVIYNDLISIDENGMELLKQLQKEKCIECTTSPVYSYLFLYNVGVIFTYVKDDKVFMVMPKETKKVIAKVDFEKLALEQERYRSIEKYLVAFSNLYGIFEPELLIETFNEQNIEKIDDKELEIVLNKFIGKTGLVDIVDGEIVHEALLSIEGDIEQLKELRRGKEYYKANKETVNNYAHDGYIDITDEHIKFKTYLENVCNDDDKASKIFEDICITLSTVDFDAHDLGGYLQRNNIEIKNTKQFEEVLKLVINVSNNTRKWANKGFTANEISKEVLNDNAMKKVVGRNDPCICGSGKKYKKCCGK